MKPIRLLNLGLIAPVQTQAIYHALAERMTAEAQDVIILCRPSQPYLCLGYHQVFESIFDRAECERRGLPVYRRRIGGGATYLDKNQLFYQCIFHHSHLPAMLRDIYACALAAPMQVLRTLGLNAALRDTNEIEVDEKRIAGTGGGRIGEATVVVGNLLFDFDFEAMSSVWRVPWPAFRVMAEKALRTQIVTLGQLDVQNSPQQLTDLLIKSFAESFGRPLQADTLTPDEICAVEEEARQLAAPDFLALHQTCPTPEPTRTLKISARALIRADEMDANGCHVRGNFWLNSEIIQAAMLESEPNHDWQSTEKQLCGVNFKAWKDQIHKACSENQVQFTQLVSIC